MSKLPPFISTKNRFSELDLLLELCNPPSELARQEIHLDTTPTWDWKRFVVMANRHGYLSPLCNQLASYPSSPIPPNVQSKITKSYKQQSMRAMKLLRTLHNVSDIFDQHCIRFLAIKGPVLSQQIHGSSIYRRSLDLDFLISQEDVRKVDKILRTKGFIRLHPKADLSNLQQKIFMARDNVACYEFASTRIEIHWRLFENPNYLDIAFDELWHKRTVIALTGKVLPTLGHSDNLLYLLAHGAKHFWIYLKWMDDIVAFSKIIPSDDYNEAVRLARKYDLSDVMFSSLDFIRTFYGKELKISTPPSAPRSKRYRRLISAFRCSFCESSQLGKEVSPRWARTLIFLRQFHLKSTFSYRMRLTLRWLINFEDLSELQLPSALFPLYIFLRPVFWLKRFIKGKTDG
ncbi:nucleotidyltransferase family protein [Thalassospira sp. HJ]|uniref:nucleotidyltransferase domain-containing protein n=1 Tax=Thalassospira sp. HJ TaxID=1616823 RepID=UPI000AC43C7F|nr:nucleotidyltransferase family protein [Thalassospira sp. HJ]